MPHCRRCHSELLVIESVETCPTCIAKSLSSDGIGVEWASDRFPQLGSIRSIEGRAQSFQAEDYESGRAVLLHLIDMPSDSDDRRHLAGQIERRANLRHPRLTSILDHDALEDFFYVIEVAPEGQPLREAIQKAKVSREQMLSVNDSIQEVLQWARDRGSPLTADAEAAYLDGDGRVRISGLGFDSHQSRFGQAWLEEHPAVGIRIGHYELVEKIGEGGFAEVFKARQQRPVEREVAIKILKLGSEAHQSLERFTLERKVLAQMNHPGIATIHDAGVTESGRPYIVMELVEGDHISKYAETEQLTLRHRASLIGKTAHAIHHGHSKGIIHRDIKPSNILVSKPEGVLTAKVIDFGIARASEEDEGANVFTRTQQFVGSPSYMSPEHMNGSAELDARSDVYSLGCVLYELLVGEPPLPEARVTESELREILDITEKEQVDHPADRFESFPEEKKGLIAQMCRLDPEAYLALLSERGISDITLKALSKQPGQRYLTAAELEEDLERWGDNQPVEAPKQLRRASKRARQLLVGGLVLVALVAGVWSLTRFVSVSEPRIAIGAPILPNDWKDYGEPSNGKVITNTEGIELVGIEPGSFQMGSPTSEPGRDPDEQLHQVELRHPFYIGRHEVTVAQFLRFLNDAGQDLAEQCLSIWGEEGGPTDYLHQVQNPSKGTYIHRPGKGETWGDPDHPMIRIHHVGARHYCEWLTKIERDLLPEGYVYDLPSEAQWEYACRAGSQSAFSSGNTLPAEQERVAPAATLGSIHALTNNEPNRWGIYGMHGNASEWVYDFYSQNFYDTPNATVDPLNNASGDQYESHVVRGGSWIAPEELSRSANRFYHNSGRTAKHIGFRLALVPIDKRSDCAAWLAPEYPAKSTDLPSGVAQVMIFPAKSSQMPIARRLEARFRTDKHRILMVKSMESLHGVSDGIEVRYLHQKDQALAESIAETVRSFSLPVTDVKFVNGFQHLDPPQTVEIWFSHTIR